MEICWSSNEYRMSRKYVNLNVLNRTDHSQVTKRVQLSTYRVVAVKKYYKYNCDLDKIKNEIEVLKEVDHPNIVKFIEKEENKRKIYLIMEYVNGRTLREELAARRRLEGDDVRKLVMSLLSAMNYLHSLKICHMDVKTSNVMVTENFDDVKLIDLGNAKKFPGENPLTLSKSGTARFAAPEFGLSRGCCPFKADVWSLGVVIARSCSRAAQKVNLAVFVADMRNSLKRKLEEDCGDDALVELVGRMCRYHPNARASMEKLNDDWLAESS